MAALTAITPSNAGTVSAGAAVAASDTISLAVMGQRGAYLEVINGNASPDVVAISDGGSTPAGNASAGGGGSVTNATAKVFFIPRAAAAAATGLVTVTHSVTTTVTYKLYPV